MSRDFKTRYTKSVRIVSSCLGARGWLKFTEISLTSKSTHENVKNGFDGLRFDISLG